MKDVVSLSGYAGSHGASLPNAYSDSSSSKNEDKRKAINQTRNKYNAKTQDAPRFATDQNHFLQKIESANGENALRIYAAPGGGIWTSRDWGDCVGVYVMQSVWVKGGYH